MIENKTKTKAHFGAKMRIFSRGLKMCAMETNQFGINEWLIYANKLHMQKNADDCYKSKKMLLVCFDKHTQR